MSTIWLIDDDPDIRLLVCAGFEIGCPDVQVIEFESGARGAAAIRAGAAGTLALPAFALIDQRLPGTHGLELIALAQSLGLAEKVPLYILTSSDDPREHLAAIQAGVVEYLIKPLGFDGILEMVERLAARHLR